MPVIPAVLTTLIVLGLAWALATMLRNTQ